jgi:murein DD-endopeptidase MepM/ murein hydrolase activator NlpD
MTVVDHAFTGGLLGFALHPFIRTYISKPKAVLLVMLATLLPDLDYITRLFGTGYYYNAVNNLYVSHRGFFHSVGGILFFAAVGLLCYFLFCWSWKKREGDPSTFPKILVIAGLFLAGGALHLLEDMLGPNGPWGGLVLYFPFSEARYLGMNLYGWYDFFLIYLFAGAFLLAVLMYLIARLSRIPSEKLDRIILVLVVGAFALAAFHLWMSPGYPEELGFKNAEKVWKGHQLSILPTVLRNFSDRAQTSGMNTLFATLPNIQTKHYVIGLAVVFGGLFLFLFLRMVVYLLFRKRLKERYRVSPVRTFLLVFFLFIVLPPGSVYLYLRLNMPVSVPAATVPVASGFDYPVGDKTGTEKGWNGKDDKGWYVGQAFLDPYYHPGEDWNGKGGGNTDFGQPVYAVAEGKVVFAENCFHWGNMLLIEHRLPSGEMIFTLYAHLKDLPVKTGDVIQRRQQVGTVGRGYKDATYKAAHLHFEIRKGNMARFPVVFWPRTLTYVPRSGVTSENLPAWIQAHYVDPSLFIGAHRKLGENGKKLKKPKKSAVKTPGPKPAANPPTDGAQMDGPPVNDVRADDIETEGVTDQNRLDAAGESSTVH